jgi:hypothetical protein
MPFRFTTRLDGHANLGQVKAALANYNLFADAASSDIKAAGDFILRIDDCVAATPIIDDKSYVEPLELIGIEFSKHSTVSSRMPDLLAIVTKMIKNGDAYIDEKASLDENVNRWKVLLNGTESKTKAAAASAAVVSARIPLTEKEMGQVNTTLFTLSTNTPGAPIPHSNFYNPVLDLLDGVENVAVPHDYYSREKLYFWLQKKTIDLLYTQTVKEMMTVVGQVESKSKTSDSIVSNEQALFDLLAFKAAQNHIESKIDSFFILTKLSDAKVMEELKKGHTKKPLMNLLYHYNRGLLSTEKSLWLGVDAVSPFASTGSIFVSAPAPPSSSKRTKITYFSRLLLQGMPTTKKVDQWCMKNTVFPLTSRASRSHHTLTTIDSLLNRGILPSVLEEVLDKHVKTNSDKFIRWSVLWNINALHIERIVSGNGTIQHDSVSDDYVCRTGGKSRIPVLNTTETSEAPAMSVPITILAGGKWNTMIRSFTAIIGGNHPTDEEEPDTPCLTNSVTGVKALTDDDAKVNPIIPGYWTTESAPVKLEVKSLHKKSEFYYVDSDELTNALTKQTIVKDDPMIVKVERDEKGQAQALISGMYVKISAADLADAKIGDDRLKCVLSAPVSEAKSDTTLTAPEKVSKDVRQTKAIRKFLKRRAKPLSTVSVEMAIPLTLYNYTPTFMVDSVTNKQALNDCVNLSTCVTASGFGEQEMKNIHVGDIFKIDGQGYFRCLKEYDPEEHLSGMTLLFIPSKSDSSTGTFCGKLRPK